MHAMSSRHANHHFQHYQEPSATPPPSSSPYQPYPHNEELLSPIATYACPQGRNTSPYTPYVVTHHTPHSSSSRSRSPIFQIPGSSAMPPAKSPAPPSSAHGHTRDAVLSPLPTPRPPEDVVMTSTIKFARDNRDRPIINQYLIGHRLGVGQHGEVFKGYDMARGNMVVAIKACRRKNSKEAKVEQLRQRNQSAIPRSAGSGANSRPRLVDQLQSSEKKVLREIAIMKKCKHGQIVQLYEVINDRLTNKILLIMEYMGGGEVKWRDESGRPCLRVDQTRRICRDVVLGLLYLHHQGIIHRDIKPANLLWTADRKNVKITDFGVSHFSAAQRIDALKSSPAYQEALQRRKEARRRREEEVAGTATPGRRRTSVWRGRGSGLNVNDIKGKGRAQDDPPPPSSALKSDLSSPCSDDENAAAEKELLEEIAGDIDPILHDDGGLSRQAGTPSFLAPEIIWEFGEKQTAVIYSKIGFAHRKRKDGENDASLKEEDTRKDIESGGRDGADMDKAPPSLTRTPTLRTPCQPSHIDEEATPRASDSASKTSLELPTDIPSQDLDETQVTVPDPDPSSFHDPNVALVEDNPDVHPDDLPPRPPITKAIDVWALGVTLYCLLFGRTPWSGVTEFAMYQMIHTDDFQVDFVMGYDRIPTGGRFHDPDDSSEGAIVVGLLDRLLEKDCSKRITLKEVKKLPWITRDIPNPEDWLVETAPERLDPIRITSADEEIAMSTVKFRWFQKPLRRFRTLLPSARLGAIREQEQAKRRTEQHNLFDAELDKILQRSMHIESESEKSEAASLFTRRIGGTEGLSLLRKPSRSRRVANAVERGVRKISRQTPDVSGGETPRNMKRRTLPDLMIGSRGRSLSQSQSRETSRSRPSSRASGPATPRIVSGGSCSNLTSPSTVDFTSDGETDILDSDDLRAIRASRSQRKMRREQEKELRQKPSARQSLSKILSWRPKGSPRASLSESGSKGSLGWKAFSRSPASPASPTGGSGSGSGTGSGPTSARASFATQRLTRRSADEFGATRKSLAGSSGARAAVPGIMGIRSDSGPAIASAGVISTTRSPALASADELTSARRASSWGDVADEFNYDYGYGANARRRFDPDADGVSDYGFGNGSAFGDYMYGQGRTSAYGSGDVDMYGYTNEDEEMRLVGAGGILSHPVSAGPSSPSSLSAVSVGGGAAAIPQDGFSLQGVAQEVGSAGAVPSTAGSQVMLPSPGTASILQTQLQEPGRRRGTSVGSKHTHHYPHVVTSPLAQAPLSVEHEAPLSDDQLDLDDGVNVSLSRNSSAEGSVNINIERSSGILNERIVVGCGVRSLRVAEEVQDNDVFADDDSSSGEDAPIEVKRRRPSEVIARSRSRVRPEQPDSSQVPVAGVDDDAEIC